MPVVEGQVTDITFRNDENGWTVLRLKSARQRVTAVGVLPFAGVGERLRLTGEWHQHPDFGQQLQVSSVESLPPETRDEVERYLASGLIRGIGPATAKLLVNQYGKDALRIIEHEPARLVEVPGIGSKRAAMIAESFAQQMGMRQMMLFLQQFQLSPNLCMRIYARFGESTERVIRENPYRLVDEVPGVGFHTADEIAKLIGIPHNSEYRISSGIQYVLTQAAEANGHMFLPREDLLFESVRLLELDEDLVERALRQLCLNRALVETDQETFTGIYLASLYDAEREVADRLMLLIETAPSEANKTAEVRIRRYEMVEGLELSAQQREAAEMAGTVGTLIITGGPGTGKTTVIRCLLSLLASGGEILLAAPTGRAAKRMSEATGSVAQTIHRLLECGGPDGRFQRDETNPLDAHTLIVDEMSMVDIRLMRSLLRALKPGTRLILVGDADQLPSVGAGNVLSDLIASEQIPVVRLTEIYRQAAKSMIVQNAHRINRGLSPRANTPDSDFFLERKNTIQDTAAAVLDLVSRRIPAYLHVDPLRDIQTLTPMKKGDVGVWQLNRLLQERLNPASPGKAELRRGDVFFRLGDKVMQVRNDYQLAWTRHEEDGSGIYNGDMGFITDVDLEEETLEVTYEDDRVAVYDDTGLDDLELAYCISVHKSQGSEFPVVILPLYNGPAMLLTRNLLYTAVTRAKRLVVVVGREACLQQMVSSFRTRERYSALGKQLLAAHKRITES